MKTPLLVGIDVGTTSVKATLFDEGRRGASYLCPTLPDSTAGTRLCRTEPGRLDGPRHHGAHSTVRRLAGRRRRRRRLDQPGQYPCLPGRWRSAADAGDHLAGWPRRCGSGRTRRTGFRRRAHRLVGGAAADRRQPPTRPRALAEATPTRPLGADALADGPQGLLHPENSPARPLPTR